MPYIIIAIAIAVVGVLFFFLQPASGGDQPKPDSNTPIVQTRENKSRKSISGRLKNLEQSSAPKSLSPGAMCYKTAAAPNRAEYVCPVCGEKTLYSNNSTLVDAVLYDIPAARRIAASIKDPDVQVTIDEKTFCRKCSPKKVPAQLCMSVAYAGDTLRHTTCGITSNDVLLVSEFLSGKEKHTLEQDAEAPLKKYIGRLDTLLGASPASPEAPGK
jgi:hypothetical protein